MSLLSEPVDVELLAPMVLVLFLAANAEVVIPPAVKSAIAVTIASIINPDDVLFVCIIYMHESLLLYKKLVNNRVKYPNIAKEYQYILI
jgi:hypothetical protein